MVETDYNNFAVLYSCRVKDFGTSTSEKIWVLSREPTQIGDSLWKDVKRVSLESLALGFPDKEVGAALAKEEKYSLKLQGKPHCIYSDDLVPKNKKKDKSGISDLYDFD